MKAKMKKKIGFTVFITVVTILAPIMVLAPTNEGEEWNEMPTDDRAIIYEYHGSSWQKLKARYTDAGDWDYTGTTWKWTGDGDSGSKFRFWVDQEAWWLTHQSAYIKVRKHGDSWGEPIAEDSYGPDRADCNVQIKFSDLISDLGLVGSNNWYQFEAQFSGSFTFFGTTTYKSTFTVKFYYV